MNLYEILGVDRQASSDDIKKAWRSKAKEHHPDVNNGSPESEELIKLVNQAYETLSDPHLRARYDAEITVGRNVSRWHIPVDLRIAFPVNIAIAFLGGNTRFSYLRSVLYHDAPVVTMATANIAIPKRCREGSILRVIGGGNSSRSGSAVTTGDLYLMVTYALENEDVVADRAGNVYGRMELPWRSALMGESVFYRPFPDGIVPGQMSEVFPVKLEPHHGQGHVYQIAGQGFSNDASIFVKVFYHFPTNMSAEDRASMIETLKHYV